MSTDLSSRAQPRAVDIGDPETLRVEVVFHDLGPHQADTIAAEMVSRAHELANLPEHACDVDVNVRLVPPEDPGASSAAAR